MATHSQKPRSDTNKDKPQGAGKPKVQAKLSVNAPGDVYEQEAETNAERVARLASKGVDNAATGLIGASVHKKKTAATGSDISAPASFQAALSGTKSDGTSLGGEAKTFMEQAFSSDFSGVRIHNGNDSADLNDQINSRAFTTGNDIYFNKGEFSPGTVEGKKLLAHELTHVQQQKTGSQPSPIQRQKQRRPGRGHGQDQAQGQGQGTRRGGARPRPARVTVDHVEVNFTSVFTDRGYQVPAGTATAHFSDHTTASTAVTGGSIRPGYGVTDRVSGRTIHRVEDAGYLNHNNDAMPYAVFYNRGEALHIGSLSVTSHGCVHVADRAWMARVNRGAVRDHTTVTVIYSPDVWTRVSTPAPLQPRTTPATPPPRRGH